MSLSRTLFSSAALRPALRQSCPALGLSLRAASTSANVNAAADKAKEAASNAGEKASETAEAAKSSAASAAQRGSAALSSLGNRVGGLLGCAFGGIIRERDCSTDAVAVHLAAYREPVVNNILVVREMGKQIYIQEKLQPPTNPQAIREAYEEFYHNASSGTWWRSIFESGQWKRIALYAAEAYGIFTIGEMIGRRCVKAMHCDWTAANTDCFPRQARRRIQDRALRTERSLHSASYFS